MQKQNWDYLFIVDDEGRPRYVNGQEIPNWQQGPTGFGYMEKLVWQGWELVSHSSVLWLGSPITKLPWIFKRLKK